MHIDRHRDSSHRPGALTRLPLRRLVAAWLAVLIGLVVGLLPDTPGRDAQAAAPAVAALPAATTGTSGDGRYTLTKTASATSLPAGGGPVTYTYSVRNLSGVNLYYRSLTDDKCGTPGVSSGMSSDRNGSYITAGGTATFTCTQLVTATVTNTATAAFSPLNLTASTATATATVTVAAGTGSSCDTLWFASFDGTGAGGGTFGVFSASPTQLMPVPSTSSPNYPGVVFNDVTALGVVPTAPSTAYFTTKNMTSSSTTANDGLYTFDLVTKAWSEVTGAGRSPAWQTNRLAVAPDGTVWSWAQNGRLYSWKPGQGAPTDRGVPVAPASSGLNMATLSSGDIAFDGTGTMWLIGSTGNSTSGAAPQTYLMTAGATELAKPTGAQTTLVGTMANAAPSGTSIYFNGMAFTTDGTLYATATSSNSTSTGVSYLYKVNPMDGTTTYVRETTAFQSIGDLGTCATPLPKLQATKTASPSGAVKAGDVVTYTAIIRNLGNIPDTGVTFRDAIPANTTYVPGSTTLNGGAIQDVNGAFPYLQARQVNGATTSFPGVLPPGDTATITFKVRVNNPISASVTEISNQATVNDVVGTPILTDDPSLPGASDPTRNPVAVPGIAVAKSPSTTSVLGSAQVTYTYSVTNDGNEALRAVSLADDRCPNPVLQDANLTTGTGDVNLDGLLGVTEIWVYTCVQTLAYPVNAPSVTNTATARGTGNVSGSAVTDTATATVTVGPTPAALDVRKSAGVLNGPDTGTGLYTVSYTVQVANSGQTATQYGPLTDTPAFAPSLEIIQATWSGQTTGSATGPGPYQLAGASTPLPGLTTHTYSITLTFRYRSTTAAAACAGPGTGLHNSVAVPQTETTTTNNAACVAPPPAPTLGLTLTKTAGTPQDTNGRPGIQAGDTIAYSFQVRNTSSLTVTTVGLSDPMFPAPQYRLTCAASSLAPGAQTTCQVLDAASGASATHVITQAEMDAGAVDNTATATADPPSPLPRLTSSSSATVSLAATRAIALDKRVVTVSDVNGNGVTDPGDSITYDFLVTNSGSVTLTGVQVTDQLLGVVTCPQTTLAPGASTTCTAAAHTVTTQEQTAGAVNNSATATGTPPSGAAPTSADTTSTPVASAADLRLTKVAGTSSALDPSSGRATVTYTITVTNAGGTPASYGLNDSPAFAPGVVIDSASWSGQAPGAATGSGPYLLAAAGTALAPGAVHTYTLTVTYHYTRTTAVTGCTGQAGGGLFNEAALDNGTSATACAAPPAPPAPGLSFEKAMTGWTDVDANGLVSPGDTLTYSFTVRNTGTTELTAVGVSDPRLGAVTCPATVLAPGGQMTCTAPAYTVTAGDLDTGSVDNTATATGTPPNLPDLTSASRTSTPVLSAGLTLDKVAGPVVDANGSGRQDTGDTIAYTFTVTNTGTTVLTPVTISDPRLGLTDAPCVASLAPQQTATCTASATFTIGQPALNAGSLTNTATATGTPPGGATPVQGTDSVTVGFDRVASLSLKKNAGQIVDLDGNGADAGDEIRYTFTVTNTGTVTLGVPSIDDSFFGVFACGAGGLLPGQSVSCDAPTPHVITQGEIDAGTIDNTATATATSPPGTTVTPDRSSTSTKTDALAGLQLTKSAVVGGTAPTTAGDLVTYTFTVHNPSPRTLSNVTISDPLLQLVNAPCVTTLAPGETATCTTTGTYALTQTDLDERSVYNQATAQGTDSAGNVVQASDDLTTPLPDATLQGQLVKTGTVQDPDTNGNNVGDPVVYTFTVTNTGTRSLNYLRIDDPKLGLADAVCGRGPVAPGATFTCQVTGRYVLTQADIDAGYVDNTATLRASGPRQLTFMRTTDDERVALQPPAQLELTKSGAMVEPGVDQVGSKARYTFTVRNSGATSLTHVTITDALLGFTPADPLVCTEGPLAPGESATCESPVTHALTQAEIDAGVIHNDAAATAEPVTPGITAPQATATADIPVTVANSLTLAKSAGDVVDQDGNGPDAGDTIQYTFTVRNTGSQVLSPVTITDPLLGLNGARCIDSLAAGATATCSVTPTYALTQADVDAGFVANDATATGVAPNGDRPTAPSSARTDVTRVAGVVLDKRVVEVDGTPATPTTRARAASTVTYELTVTNTSNVTLSGIAVTDPKIAPGVITCGATSLAPSGQTTCRVTYTITTADVDATQVANTATVTATGAGLGPVRDDATAVIGVDRSPGLSLNKEFVTVATGTDGIYSVGDLATYRFTVVNTGDTTLGDVVIDDPRLQLGRAFCAPGPLAPGETVTCEKSYPLEQADIDAGDIVNTATAIAIPVGGDPAAPATATDTATAPGATQNSISLDKTAGGVTDTDGDGRVSVGDTVSYTFQVRNTGSQTLRDVTITDRALGLDGWPCAAGPVAPGEQVVCASPVVHTLTQAEVDAGTLDNAASANAVAPGPDPAPATDTTSTPLDRVVGLTLTKTFATYTDRAGTTYTDAAGVIHTNRPGESAGDLLTYTFTITNTSNVTLSAASIRDDKLGIVALTCQSPTIAPKATVTCTSPPYTLTQADIDSRRVDNTATATALDPKNGQISASDVETYVLTPEPGIALDKQVIDFTDTADGNGQVDAGGTVRYRFVVTNTGVKTMTNVRIVDSKLGIDMLCAATLAVDASVTCDAPAPYPVSQADTDAGVVHNVATAHATAPSGRVMQAEDPNDLPADRSSGFTVAKTAAPFTNVDGSTDASGAPTATPGDLITYRFTVRNTGTVSLRAITVADPLLASQDFVCISGPLAPGAVATCERNYRLTQADIDAGSVHNRATVTVDVPSGAPVPAPQQPEVTVPLDRAPALTLTKKATEISGEAATNRPTVVTGDTVVYSYTVRNSGNTTMSDVTITDDKFAAPFSCVMTVTNADGTAVTSPETSTTLASGQTGTCRSPQYVVTRADVNSGGVTNTATASATPPTPPNGTPTPLVSNPSSVTVAAGSDPLLTLTKSLTTVRHGGADTTVPAGTVPTVQTGDLLTFTFVVTNGGNRTVDSLTVTDVVAGTTTVPVTCELTTLAPGAQTTCTGSYTVSTTDADRGSAPDTATASATAPANDPASPPITVRSPEASLTVPVDTSPGIAVVKRAALTDGDGDGLADAGEQIRYTFALTNTGQVTLTGIGVQDTLAGAVTCPVEQLAPGGTTTCTATAPYTVTAADVDAGAVDNTATATGTPPSGPALTASSSAVTSTDSRAEWTLTKTAGPVTDLDGNGPDAGDTVQFSFAVRNTGTVTLHGVTITDPLLGDPFACATGDLLPGRTATCTAPPFTLRQSDVDALGLVNSATAAATGPTSTLAPISTPTPSPAATTTVPVVASASWTLDKRVAAVNGAAPTATVSVGDVIGYEFEIVNTGTITLTGVGVSDPLVTAMSCPVTTLAPGARVTCTASHQVTQDEVDGGAVVNTATATAIVPTGVTGPPGPVTDGTSTPTAADRNLTLVKSATLADTDGDGLADAGEAITYRFVVTNTGTLTVRGVTVDDPMLAAAGAAVTCPVTSLAPGAATTCTATYTVTPADVDAGAVANVATAGGSTSQGPVRSRGSGAETPTDSRADWTLAKSAQPVADADGNGVDAGDTVVFVFEVRNTGTVTLHGITIDDPMLGAPFPCFTADLAPGATAQCTSAPYTLTQADIDSEMLRNVATAGATAPAPATLTPTGGYTPTTTPSITTPANPPASATATATIGLAPRPGIGLTKRAATVDGTPVADGATVTPGSVIGYDLVVTNTGTVTLTGIAVDDPMVTTAGATVVCPRTVLEPGAQTTCQATYTVTQADADAGSVVNTATAGGTPPATSADPRPPVTRSARASASNPITRTASLSLDKVITGADLGADGATVGDTISYQFVVTNTGTVTLTGVSVTDAKVGAVTCPTTTLAPTDSTTCTAAPYRLTQADLDNGTVVNTATADATAPSGVPAPQTARDSATASTSGVPAIAVEKSAALADVSGPGHRDGYADADEVITYTFVVTNTGTVTLGSVGVDDPQVGPVTCPGTTLAPKAATTCTVRYTVTPADVDRGTIHNSAVAHATPGTPPGAAPVRSGPSTVDTPTNAVPALALVKTAALTDGDGDGLADAGEAITYRFAVTNTGTVTMTGIAINDPLLATTGADVTCPATTLAAGDSTTCTATYTVTQGDVDAGTVANVATAVGTPPVGGTTTTPGSGTETPTDSRAAWTLTKTAGAPVDANASGRLDAGDTVQFTLVVTNTGTVTLTGITVTDPLLDRAEVAVTCQAGPLPPGRSMSCSSGVYALTQADIDAGLVANVATATATAAPATTLTPVAGYTPTATPSVTSPVSAPPGATASATATAAATSGITMTKRVAQADPADPLAQVGERLTYTFEVHNDGVTMLTGLTIDDPMLTRAGITVRCPARPLAPGATVTCEASPYTVTAADGSAGSIVNTATARATTPTGAAVIDDDSASVPTRAPAPTTTTTTPRTTRTMPVPDDDQTSPSTSLHPTSAVLPTDPTSVPTPPAPVMPEPPAQPTDPAPLQPIAPGVPGGSQAVVVPAPRTGSGLAYTGAEVLRILGTAAGLLVAGIGLMLVSRRRRDGEDR